MMKTILILKYLLILDDNFDIEANKMWGLGTPEDLNYYLENYEG